MIVSIEGNKCSGKSKLIILLKEKYKKNKNIIFVDDIECMKELLKFQDDDKSAIKLRSHLDKYNCLFQIMKFVCKQNLLKKLVDEYPNKIIIMENLIEFDIGVSAKILYNDKVIDNETYKFYQSVCNFFNSQYKPKKVIYVKTDQFICYKRILQKITEEDIILTKYHVELCDKYIEKILLDRFDKIVLDGSKDFGIDFNKINTYLNMDVKDVYEKGGYLELIMGPMFSGKTSKLIEIYKQCKFCEINVSIINHSIDNRYHDELLSNHDKIMVPCFKTKSIHDIWYNHNNQYYDSLRDSKVILINEGQFFDDLYDPVLNMVKCGKKVYIGGLDGDFMQKKFGKMLDLIPHSDKITKLTSLCSICKDGTPGIFSMRLNNNKEQIEVGSDNYVPVCRSCYNDNVIDSGLK